LVCHAETREDAIEKTIRAIDEYEITGLETTLGFCKYVMHHDAFRSGKFDTRFVEKYFKPEVLQQVPDKIEELLAGVLSTQLLEIVKTTNNVDQSQGATSKWKKNRA
jgi:propionyl-CoA carboxylase alpha chain